MLRNRIALVTGSSRGIGAVVAKRLAFDGARVIIHGHTNLGAARSVADAINASGAVAHVLQADLNSSAHVATLVRSAAEIYGGVDIFVNKAGGAGGGAPTP